MSRRRISKLVVPDLDLSPFDELEINPKLLNDPNKWGELKMLNPTTLDIPARVQREAIVPHVKQIVTDFNHHYFGVLIVARFSINEQIYLWVVDGGQRLTAVNLRNKIMQSADKSVQIIKQVPCIIVDVANQKEASSIFVWIDEYRRKIAFEDRLRAGIIAHDPKYVLADKYYRRFENAGAGLSAPETIFRIARNRMLREPLDAILDDIIIPLSLESERHTLPTQVLTGLINLQGRMALCGNSLCAPSIRKKILNLGPVPLADQCRAVAFANQHGGDDLKSTRSRWREN
jgi:hypothetical protein